VNREVREDQWVHWSFFYFLFLMVQFPFEGKVEWDMDTNNRGKMEDISTKGRGGKVGSGVSGGEESLSSLLFALALLQTIEASPSCY